MPLEPFNLFQAPSIQGFQRPARLDESIGLGAMVGHGLEVVDGFGATRLLQHFDLGDSAEIGLQAFTALRASDLAELSAAVSDPQAERGGSFGGGLEEYEVQNGIRN